MRSAVLAAAARAVDAKPHDAERTTATRPASTRFASTHPFASRRWPLSAAALLVISIMTGLVATHGWWERPELVDPSQDRSQAPNIARPAEPASAAAPPQAEKQRSGPLAANADNAGVIAAENIAADMNTGAGTGASTSARREPAPRASPRNASKQSSAPMAEAPILARSDLASESRSNAAPRKSEMEPSDAAPAPSAPAAAQRPYSPAADEPTTAQPPARATGRAKSGADSSARFAAEPESPDAWVARIVKLRETGNDDEADREVARLKQRYPEFTIPREALRSMGTR